MEPAEEHHVVDVGCSEGPPFDVVGVEVFFGGAAGHGAAAVAEAQGTSLFAAGQPGFVAEFERDAGAVPHELQGAFFGEASYEAGGDVGA